MRRTATIILTLLPILALAGPSIVGDFTTPPWNPADAAFDLVPLGSGYTLTVNLTAGHHEYKCVETDEWGTDFPWNIMLDLAVDQDVTFYANLGATVGLIEFDEFVAHQAPILAGDFLDLWGGAEWDPADPAGMMMQVVGTDLFILEGLLPAGHHECKVTLNGNWDQNTGDNFILDLVEDTVGAFTYEFGTNTLSWDPAVATEEMSFSEVKTQF